MISEWMKVMLGEISRKKAEEEQMRSEEQARSDEQRRNGASASNDDVRKDL